MTYPAYGIDRDFVWAETSCSWCGGEDEDPCSDACERQAVLAARMRRVEGLREQAARAMTLAEQYASESGWSHPRTVEVLDHVLVLERRIRGLVELVERDTLPALGEP